MDYYRFSATYVSRKNGKGRSAVAAASYQSRERIHNEHEGRTYDYTKKGGFIHSEIYLPENAPPEFFDRGTLWNAVEKAESRSNARTAREIILALPRARILPILVSKELLTNYIIETFVSQGMIADIAIHEGDHSDNPHAHILLTTRDVGPDGFGAKNRDWDKRENIERWREAWANAQNREFMLRGLDARVAHKSYKRRNMDRKPTLHLGPALSAMERRQIKTCKGDYNRTIEAKREEQERQNQMESELHQSRGRERGR